MIKRITTSLIILACLMGAKATAGNYCKIGKPGGPSAINKNAAVANDATGATTHAPPAAEDVDIITTGDSIGSALTCKKTCAKRIIDNMAAQVGGIYCEFGTFTTVSGANTYTATNKKWININLTLTDF